MIYDIIHLTRLENNCVENWFGHLKHDLLLRKRVASSELSTVLYKRNKAKFFEFYSESEENIILQSNLKEKWQDKKKKNLKREKGYYYKKEDLYYEMNDSKMEFTSYKGEIENKEYTELFKSNRPSANFENMQIDTTFESYDKKNENSMVADDLEILYSIASNIDIINVAKNSKIFQDNLINLKCNFNYLKTDCIKLNTQQWLLKHFFLDNYNLVYYKIKGDGNCFFRAISLFFMGDQKYHDLFRKCLRNYDETSLEFFKRFDISKKELEKNKNLKWGSDIDIIQVCRMNFCQIYTFSTGIGNGWLKYSSKEDNGKENQNIFLSHTNNNHYDLLVPKHFIEK